MHIKFTVQKAHMKSTAEQKKRIDPHFIYAIFIDTKIILKKIVFYTFNNRLEDP